MQKVLPYIILIAFLAILVTSVIFLSRKFAWIFNSESTASFYILFSLLPLFFIIAGGAFINATGTVGHVLYRFAAVMMGVYLFLLLSFLVVDLLNIVLKLEPERYGVVAFGLTLLTSLFGYWNGAYIRTTKIEVPISGLNDEITAVHLTDLHIGHFRNNGYLDKVIEKTNKQEADVVFLTGDYLDSRYALKQEHFEPLKDLKAPVYFVDGNHDHSTDNESISAHLRKVGVHVLENELAHFKNLQIVGLSYMLADRNSFDMHASEHSPTIAETLPQIKTDKDKPLVLLHHAPNGVEYAHRAGVDLYLSGHTHAGQIFPFNYLANLIFDYNRGLHTYKETLLLVSEGVGTFGPPFRLGTKSEIIRLSLIPK